MVDLTPNRGMTPIVRTIARWLRGIVFLFGIYIILFGHITPGGGFAGGVILALTYVLMTLCCGKETSLSKMPLHVAGEIDSLGALMFLVIAWLGVWGVLGGGFFTNYIAKYNTGLPYHLFSGGFIPLCNIAIAVKVGASLFLIFMLLVTTKVIHKPDE
jgi:multisubunit Na+/H+ antiporter MnhB subunit